MKKLLLLTLCLLLCAIFCACDTQSQPKIETVKNSQTNVEEKNKNENKNNDYEQAVADEGLRHKQVLDELEADYTKALHDCDVEIYCQKVGCTMSESECKSKIEELNRQIKAKQAELNKIPSSGNSIEAGSNSINVAKRAQLQGSIQSLQSQRYQYDAILQKYEKIRFLEQKKISIENDYTDAVLEECELHEERMKSIKKQK